MNGIKLNNNPVTYYSKNFINRVLSYSGLKRILVMEAISVSDVLITVYVFTFWFSYTWNWIRKTKKLVLKCNCFIVYSAHHCLYTTIRFSQLLTFVVFALILITPEIDMVANTQYFDNFLFLQYRFSEDFFFNDLNVKSPQNDTGFRNTDVSVYRGLK